MSFTTEMKVGLFVVASLILLVIAFAWSVDGVKPGERAYRVETVVPSAEGLWEGTPVRLAGIEIGSIENIEVDPNGARLYLAIRSRYALPADTTVELRSSGVLGDRFISVIPGRSEQELQEGAVLAMGEPPMDMDAIARQVQAVAADLGGTTEQLRTALSDETVADAQATVAQLAALTAALAETVQRNQDDIDASVNAIRRLAEAMEKLVDASSPKVDAGLSDLQDAAEKLDQAMEDLSSITDKVDRGEGTVGALINERTLADRLDRTLQRADAVLDTSSALKLDAWTTGRMILDERGQLAPGGTVGLALGPGEHLWMSAELVAVPELRGTVMGNARLGPASVRLGLKEGGEGVGVSGHLFGDRLLFSADAFDFVGRLGERPAGVPDLRLSLRAEPVRRLWVEFAADELMLPPSEGGVRPWVGVGLHVVAPPGR